MKLSRKEVIRGTLAAAASGLLPLEALSAQAGKVADDISTEDLIAMEKIADLHFSDEERKQILATIREQRGLFGELRKAVPDRAAEARTIFTPIGGGSIPNARVVVKSTAVKVSLKGKTDEDIAFLGVAELGQLLKSKQFTSTKLTQIYLARLKEFGPKLLCVATLTEELALAQAAEADREIAAGHYRGPLHGIPYGIKDLFDTKGIVTGFGAEPFVQRIPDEDATVVRKLREAGAVLVAKLSLGALAMNDHWYMGRTKNPWNPSEGSSGSSAGPAAATAAGLVGFSIGTETQGSITSPSQRCRVTGLRPTYGRVSRHGGMELSYTMDKVGPICRQVEDCALVFAAICGSDPLDPSAVDRPYIWPPKTALAKLKIGVLIGDDKKLFNTKMGRDPVLQFLKAHGANLQPLRLTPLPSACSLVLDVEGASAFDDLTRSGKVNDIKQSLWPQIFRAARYVPAVEYMEAQRLRTIAMHRAEEEFGDLDLFVSDGIGEYTVPLVNQCGYPQVIIPQGTRQSGQNTLPVAKSFTGRLYREEVILGLAKMVQDSGDFHHLRPDLSKV